MGFLKFGDPELGLCKAPVRKLMCHFILIFCTDVKHRHQHGYVYIYGVPLK